jgi:hypothetical protein
MTKSVQLAWRYWWQTLIATLLIFMDAMIKGSDQAIFGNAVHLYGGNVQIHANARHKL